MEEKILYFDCSSGISGDMTVGALLDLGASREELERVLRSAGVDGYHLHFGRTKKCGIDAFDFDVHLEEGAEGHEHSHEHAHEHSHEHEHEYEHTHDHEHGHTHAHGCDHMHAHDHEHSHGHEHSHAHEHSHPHPHRNVQDIYAIIDRLDTNANVKANARRMFDIVAQAESKAHGIPVEQVHFHEVGAIDSIVDVIGAAVCMDNLGAEKIVFSPLSEGRGYVRCQHGVMPVPVPAVANIAAANHLRLKLTENQGEMVTPTGAAIAAAFDSRESLPEHFHIKKVGIGAGKKDFEQANILRVMWIEAEKKEQPVDKGQITSALPPMWVLETNIDDCTGEAMGFTMERLLEAGAADAWYTPIYMKKNRPAYLLKAVCTGEKIEKMERIIFTHTTTIGLRKYPVERTVLDRRQETVDTAFGPAKVKICRYENQTFFYPEYESVREICRARDLPFGDVCREITEAAVRAFAGERE